VASITADRIVVVGAGIVGCSVAHHLTRMGRREVVVVEQGPLGAAGGSTSHAPGLVFQTNASKTLTALAAYSIELYSQLRSHGEACYYPVGSVEVAATAERWEDLKRKLGWAASWGVQAELLPSDEVARRIPLVDRRVIQGGYFVPNDGIAKAVRACEAMRSKSEAAGATFRGDVEVTGLDVSDGRIRGVVTSQGTISASTVVWCAGIWGPRLEAMTDVSVPLSPMQHQFAWTSPLPELAGVTDEVTHPILRHQDRSMYFRHQRDRYGVGSYQHRPMPVRADELLPHDQAPVMPSVMPFTEDDFKQPWADAQELIPPLRDATIDDPINGVFSFTPDGFPLLGEAQGTRRLWLAEAVWITHAGGVGKVIADWICTGMPGLDLRECSLNRFEAHAHSPAYVTARASQSFREVYDIIHPLQPMDEPRPLRVSPFYARQQELEAVSLEAMGWERPQWFEANKPLLDRYHIPARAGWAARFWSPIVGAEHLATRAGVAMYDMTPLKRLEVAGPGALGLLQGVTTNELDKRVGSITYTLMLDERGGIKSDITVARLGENRFQVGCNGPLDVEWIDRHSNSDQSVYVRDITGATGCVGVWGPAARDLVQSLSSDDFSNEAFGYFQARSAYLEEIPVVAMRLSYVGELGWEIYCSAEHGLRLWDLLWDSGRDLGVVAAGRGAFEGLRLEKGYRAWGKDMTTEDNPYEAGLEFTVKLDKGPFIGRPALERLGPPQDAKRRLSCLTLDEPSAVVMGKEPVYAGGSPVGWVTSASYGHSVGRCIAYSYLPVEVAAPGTAVEVEYFGDRLAATVSTEPLWDPKMERMRA
jgi:glycine cleavage system aminomethyltransferase T/glycine/D-amino acid oxidase-like deaminating enzyme